MTGAPDATHVAWEVGKKPVAVLQLICPPMGTWTLGGAVTALAPSKLNHTGPPAPGGT